MYIYVRSAGEGSQLGWNIALIYFLLVMILGNIILLALFTALLLKNFDPSEDGVDPEKELITEEKFAQL